MKLLKEDGMLDLDIIEEIIWHLRMSDIERLKQPTNEEGVCTIHPMIWRKNKQNVKMLKQSLQYIMDCSYLQESLYKRISGKEHTIEKLENKIAQLTKDKESVEIENSTLKEKIQEAQITAGLFIQSVKEKLPSWFKKD